MFSETYQESPIALREGCKNLLHAFSLIYKERKIRVNDMTLSFPYEIVDYDVGEFSYGNIHVYSYQKNGHLKIGRYCSISEISVIIGGDHHKGIITYPIRRRFLGISVDSDNVPSVGVEIGNDVWIGLGATILDGVKIGDGTIIGAGAVVSRDLPPYSIAVGNPAKVVKTRFSSDEVELLINSRWWELQKDEVIKIMDAGYMDNVQEFVDFVSKLRS